MEKGTKIKSILKKTCLYFVCFSLGILPFFITVSRAQSEEYNMREYFPLEENKFLTTFSHTLNGYEWEGDWGVSGTEVVNGVETYRRYYTDANTYDCLLWDNQGLKRYKEYRGLEAYYGITELPVPAGWPPTVELRETRQFSGTSQVYTIQGGLLGTSNWNSTFKLEAVEDVETPAS